ncbi:MAG TPA: hypothetical protein PKB05_07280 [Oligoflexia bacterium]|nr:hypothetical protein [Oligoflexia bacterium]
MLLTLVAACGNTQTFNGAKFILNGNQTSNALDAPQFNIHSTSFSWSYGIHLYWSDYNPNKDLLIIQRKRANDPDFTDIKTYYYGPQEDYFLALSSSYPVSSQYYAEHGTQYTFRIKVVQGELTSYSQDFTILFDPFAQAPTKPIITNLEDYSYGTHCVVQLAWMDNSQNETAYSIEKIIYYVDGSSEVQTSSHVPETTDIIETGERIIYETLPDYLIGVDYRIRAENPENVSSWTAWQHTSGFDCG